MNPISIFFLSITGVLALIGLLNGLRRGAPREGLRLVLTVVCAAVAFFALTPATDRLLAAPLINGQTLGAFLAESLGEEAAFLLDVLMPLVTIVLRVLLFIGLFLVVRALSGILFLILKIFLPKGKMRSIGALIGLVQGLVFAYCLVIPLNGLLPTAERLFALELNGAPVLEIEDETVKQTTVEYTASPLCSILSTLGQPLFGELSCAVTEDGSTVTLDGQVEAIDATVQMTDEVNGIVSVDFGSGLTSDSVGTIREHLNNLDQIKDGMSEEARSTVNNLLQSITDQMELPVDLSSIDLGEVDFSAEGELLQDIYTYQTGGELEDLQETVRHLADSTLLLPVLEGAETEIPLSDDQRDEIGAAIDALDDPAAQATLRELFGLAS